MSTFLLYVGYLLVHQYARKAFVDCSSDIFYSSDSVADEVDIRVMLTGVLWQIAVLDNKQRESDRYLLAVKQQLVQAQRELFVELVLNLFPADNW